MTNQCKSCGGFCGKKCKRVEAHDAEQAKAFMPDWVTYRQGAKDGAEQMRDRCAEVVDTDYLDAITAAREYLSAPEQSEPVCHQFQSRDGTWMSFIDQRHYENTMEAGTWLIRALYTSPPAQREWVGLTDDEVGDLSDFAYTNDEEFVRNVEAKLKEKNQ